MAYFIKMVQNCHHWWQNDKKP